MECLETNLLLENTNLSLDKMPAVFNLQTENTHLISKNLIQRVLQEKKIIQEAVLRANQIRCITFQGPHHQNLCIELKLVAKVQYATNIRESLQMIILTQLKIEKEVLLTRRKTK